MPRPGSPRQLIEGTLRTLEHDALPFMVRYYGDESRAADRVRALIATQRAKLAEVKGVGPAAL